MLIDPSGGEQWVPIKHRTSTLFADDDQRAAHPLQARERVAHVGVALLVSEPRGDIHSW